MSVIALHRLAHTPQERDEVVQEALARLRSSPPSALTTMREAAVAPRSKCVLDSSKLLSAGISLPPVQEALHTALANWIPAPLPSS